MPIGDEPHLEIEALRGRLSRLSEASLRINESLDLDRVLQGVLDSALDLTGALYGVMVLFDDSVQIQNLLTSGIPSEQEAQLWKLADGMTIFDGIGGLSKTVRHGDFQRYLRELGLPEFRAPLQLHSPLPFLFTPITYLGKPIGVIYLGDKDDGREFTIEDEEIIAMFASQSALAIANARLFRDEKRARTDLEALVNTAPVGVAVFDVRTGVPVYVNRETMRIGTELASREVAAEEVLKVLTVRRADGREMSLQEFPLIGFMETSETVLAEEIVISVPDGRSLSVLLNVTPIRSDEGEVESLIVTLQDMTPVEEMERLRAEFLGMVSHELRAPLSSIKGSAATLTASWSSLDPAELDLFFRIIEQQADRMSGLITDLLDVARIETGSLSVTPAPVEVAGLVDEAKNAYLTSGGSNGVRIELPPNLPHVMADRRRIVQVLINLLSNGARNSPDLSLIKVTAELRGIHVAISVSDHGRGVPADLLPQLFRKFSRVEDQGGDTGLGLSICKGIVEAHGGRIWAESDGPGLGTRFTFTLPVNEDAPASVQGTAATQPRRALGSGTEHPRILVVDDDPQTLRYVREVLSKAAYTLSVTADPDDVARLIGEEEPNLVLLDLMLPGTDGIELMKTVRELAQVPVIFLSAYGQDEVIARAFEAGAADYVVKPFSPTELLARIKAALRRQGQGASFSYDVPAEPYVVDDLIVDFGQGSVTVAGRDIDLTDTEYRVLVELSANAGRIITHEQLLRRVWGHYKPTASAPVRVIVMRLRGKIGDDANDPKYIFTKRRVGYWMPKPDERGQEDAPI